MTLSFNQKSQEYQSPYETAIKRQRVTVYAHGLVDSDSKTQPNVQMSIICWYQ